MIRVSRFAANQGDPGELGHEEPSSPLEAQLRFDVILERLIGCVLAIRRLERSDGRGIPDKVQPV